MRLECTANKFIKIIYNINHRAPVNDVMKSNKLLTIQQLANLEIASFMHKDENGNLPSAFCNFFDQNCTILQKILPHFIKQEATPIIFQVIAESISQSNLYNIKAH